MTLIETIRSVVARHRVFAAVAAMAPLSLCVALPAPAQVLPASSTSGDIEQYLLYDRHLIQAYLEGMIGDETLRKFWQGASPPQSDIKQVLFEQGAKAASAPHPQVASVTGTYTFSSLTPGLPLVGNQLVMLNVTPFANDTNLAAVALHRKGDCSLVVEVYEPVNNFLTGSAVYEMAGFQDRLHALSGLATTPDVFPNGCPSSPLGLASVLTAQVVGVTSGGIHVVADLNPGTGTLEVQRSGAQGALPTLTLGNSAPNTFISADLNGDGLNDLIASYVTDPATSQKSLVVYLNNGDGTFQAPRYFDANLGFFLLDDFNGDGKPDIVGTDFSGNAIVLPGNGDGTFKPAVVSALGLTSGGNSLASGDFNGDGRKDLLAGNTILLGQGDGTFAVGPALLPTITNDLGFSYYAAVGDFNKDGKLDIAAYDVSGAVQILLGNGDGTFAVGERLASLPAGQHLTVTDIDGDGNLDIFVGNSDKGVFVQDSDDPVAPLSQFLMGRGDGTFVGAPVYNSSGGATGFSTSSANDFNGDGKPDVLTFGRTANNAQAPVALTLLPGDGTGRLGAPVFSNISVIPSAIATADLNHDGAQDAVLIGYSVSGAAYTVAVLLGDGKGHFATERDYGVGNIPSAVAVGDFNGDGNVDIAVGVQPQPGTTGLSGVYVLLGKGDGSFGAPMKIDGSLSPLGLAAGDLNGDGRADLVVADAGLFSPGTSHQANGALRVYLGNVNGTFTSVTVPASTATNYTAVQLGDFNGDGKVDLVAAGIVGTSFTSVTASVYAFAGNGDGSFKAATATALAGSDGSGATSLALADLNHDGFLDVVAGNPADFTEVLIGAGDGTFANSILALGENPQVVGAVDLNGDKMPELLVGGYGGLAVFVNAVPFPTASTASYSGGQVSLPDVTIGNAQYTDLVVRIASITSGPTGTGPEASAATYDPSTGQLTVPAVTVGSKTYYNAVAAVGSLVSIGGVTGADTYAGGQLSISSVQIQGGPIYSDVVVTVGKILGVGGGMPTKAMDQYNPTSHQLLIPAVEFGGKVYTNVTVTVAGVVSVNGSAP